jgi:lipopolysaccharide/colanic/teichoic acid biosynthesis glycosyltransferase
MKTTNRKEPWLLFLGDIFFFIFSLWLTLLIRFGEVPSRAVFAEHFYPFSILFIVWLIVFFIAGLYEKHTTTFKRYLPSRFLWAQMFNSLIAVTFFYLIPHFGITPKTILFIDLVVTFALVFIWRNYGQTILGLRQREKSLLVGRGEELNLLKNEVENNSRYGLEFVSVFDLDKIQVTDLEKNITAEIYSKDITVVVVDLQDKSVDKNMPKFYSLLFSRVRFVDMNSLYEEIFDRIPVSLISYNWFLENVSVIPNTSYDLLRRLADIVVSSLFGLVSLVFYPFIILAIKIEDQGDIFIVQNRVGKNNVPLKIVKFRTMSFNDNEESSRDKSNNKITTVGRFLRKSRLDEIPQLWNVLIGDLSLIGPRPELPALAQIYEKEVPYYNVRHLIQPGLSGWAQLYHDSHPHQGLNTVETKNKLSYDLYYLKHRSLFLDLQIALKTIKTLLSRTGK